MPYDENEIRGLNQVQGLDRIRCLNMVIDALKEEIEQEKREVAEVQEQKHSLNLRYLELS